MRNKATLHYLGVGCQQRQEIPDPCAPIWTAQEGDS